MGVKIICNFTLIRNKSNGHNGEYVNGIFLKVTHPRSFTEFCRGILCLNSDEDSLHTHIHVLLIICLIYYTNVLWGSFTS